MLLVDGYGTKLINWSNNAYREEVERCRGMMNLNQIVGG